MINLQGGKKRRQLLDHYKYYILLLQVILLFLVLRPHAFGNFQHPVVCTPHARNDMHSKKSKALKSCLEFTCRHEAPGISHHPSRIIAFQGSLVAVMLIYRPPAWSSKIQDQKQKYDLQWPKINIIVRSRACRVLPVAVYCVTVCCSVHAAGSCRMHRATIKLSRVYSNCTSSHYTSTALLKVRNHAQVLLEGDEAKYTELVTHLRHPQHKQYCGIRLDCILHLLQSVAQLHQGLPGHGPWLSKSVPQ